MTCTPSQTPAEKLASAVLSSQQSVIACHDCDLLTIIPQDARGKLLCSRCGAVLRRVKPHSLEHGLAFGCTATILLVLANVFPFLSMRKGSIEQDTLLLSGIGELWMQQEYLLAMLIFFTCLLVPFLQLACLFYVLTPLYVTGKAAPLAARCFRVLHSLGPWSMLEVFLIGILVALVKLSHLATIIPGLSAHCFAALVFVLTATLASLDPHQIWPLLDRREQRP